MTHPSHIPLREQNDRENYLGASEAPAILGLSPWSTPFDVWARKKGHAEPFTGNAATERGHRLERAVLEWGADELGSTVVLHGDGFDSLPVQGPKPHMAFHPDGWYMLDSEWVLVEVKTARFGDGWEDEGIPATYAAQVAYQLACCPKWVKRAVIVAFITGKDEWLIRHVERKEGIEDAFITRTTEWWERFIVGDETPALDGSDAALSYLLNVFPKPTRMLEDASDREAHLVEELAEVRRDLKALKGREAVLKQQLCEQIGEREGVYVPEVGKVKWSWTAGRKTFDRKRFEQDHPALAQQYTKQGADTRVLRFPRGV